MSGLLRIEAKIILFFLLQRQQYACAEKKNNVREYFRWYLAEVGRELVNSKHLNRPANQQASEIRTKRKKDELLHTYTFTENAILLI